MKSIIARYMTLTFNDIFELISLETMNFDDGLFARVESLASTCIALASVFAGARQSRNDIWSTSSNVTKPLASVVNY